MDNYRQEYVLLQSYIHTCVYVLFVTERWVNLTHQLFNDFLMIICTALVLDLCSYDAGAHTPCDCCTITINQY